MTHIAVDLVAGRELPQVRLTPGLMQPRLISRAAGGRAHVAIVAGGAALLGGDAVTIGIRVGQGCRLVIEDVGGTVAYPTDGAESRWDVDIEVGAAGGLIWETFPFVVASGARVRRSTRVRIGAEATVRLRETIVLGRSGEVGGALRSSTDVRDCAGRPYFVEDLDVDGTDPLPGVFGSASVLDTAMLFGRRDDATGPTAGDDVGGGTTVRMLELARPGTIARAIGAAAHESHVDSVWQRWNRPAE